MSRIAIVIAAVLAFATALPTLPAQAQNSRSFVSSTGLDTNNCSLAAPCRSFAGAYAKTNAGGEIDVLDTAGYGPLTITGAISIVNDGGTASVLVPSGGNGFTINAGVSDAVSLRGLTFEGAGVGANGILFNTGQTLTVKNCVIRHVTNDGIAFGPSASSSLLVSDTLLADNGLNGVIIQSTGSGTVTAVLNRVEVNNNAAGAGIAISGTISSGGSITVNVAESIASGNVDGVVVNSNSGQAVAKVTLFHAVVANNNVGIGTTGTNATLTVAQSAVTGNASGGWLITGSGTIQTYQDNYFNGNGANTGSLTNVSKQ
jgi:hypothetical protein